ncbi:hydroxymethylbilane synthase [Opitutus sp. ER46]|uniref:hydroxymethylbilane synthase n=1 Tax=Opitutus sp. ER46 TaxID=2161864 RepID=UPI000D3115AB|nr:hydroxymethylbilane synthase [Opitutus sp. ER46]PTX94260.1 hydroxymethylbilane synthase [Opitutus sp. ER46]
MKLVLATRKSPLALAQTEMVAAHLRTALGVETELLKIVTTGDKQTEWSLEQRGGKGLFTSELEAALQRGEADVAVHSTKDLPGDMPAGLAIGGYMPRADTRDVLVLRAGVEEPKLIATGSPRRRLQVKLMFPAVEFTEIRGNVDTRLRKIGQQHVADGTILAAAGMKRLGIDAWPDVEFAPLDFAQMVPAVGQGAIAVQCREADAAKFAAVFDAPTMRTVNVERAFQTALGGGCHTAFAAHVAGETLYLFHEQIGQRSLPLTAADFAAPTETAARILKDLGLKA